MKFFSKDLSAKLEALGCKSETNFAWIFDDYKEWEAVPTSPYDMTSTLTYIEGPFAAFSIADFLSDEPYAIENCKKVSGDFIDYECPICGLTDKEIYTWEYFRYELVGSQDQEAFIAKALEGKS